MTPFFPICCGVETTAETTEEGLESPGRAAQSLIGCTIENGRYLLRRKTGHTRTTIRYAAQDLMGGIELDLHLHPDPATSDGYRLGRTRIDPTRDLPCLCDTGETRRPAVRPRAAAGTFWRRLWSRLRSVLVAGEIAG